MKLSEQISRDWADFKAKRLAALVTDDPMPRYSYLDLRDGLRNP